MKNEILVLGKGFLGQAFEKKGYEVWGKDKFRFGEDSFDSLENYKVIINCVAKSNTRWCEKNENWEEAFFVNTKVPGLLSKFCESKGKKLVHISTGCLYDRNDVPKKETDFIATHCRYTITKAVGEYNCNPERDLILRPRLFFGDFGNKNNLLSKLPKFDTFLTELNSYTSVHTIIGAVPPLLNAEQVGIFNVACDGNMTVKELGESIGLEGRVGITGEELCKNEGLYLVNNIMDMSKLKKFYNPPKLEKEVNRCWESLKKKK